MARRAAKLVYVLKAAAPPPDFDSGDEGERILQFQGLLIAIRIRSSTREPGTFFQISAGCGPVALRPAWRFQPARDKVGRTDENT